MHHLLKSELRKVENQNKENFVAAFMELKRLTKRKQKDIADATQIDTTYFSSLIHGHNPVTDKNLASIRKVLERAKRGDLSDFGIQNVVRHQDRGLEAIKLLLAIADLHKIKADALLFECVRRHAHAVAQAMVVEGELSSGAGQTDPKTKEIILKVFGSLLPKVEDRQDAEAPANTQPKDRPD